MNTFLWLIKILFFFSYWYMTVVLRIEGEISTDTSHIVMVLLIIILLMPHES